MECGEKKVKLQQFIIKLLLTSAILFAADAFEQRNISESKKLEQQAAEGRNDNLDAQRDNVALVLRRNNTQ